MVEERQDLLLCLDVTIEVGSEYSLLFDGFQGIELILPIFFDEIDLSKGTLSYSFVELEAGEGDDLSDVFFFHELIQFEYILLPGCQFFILVFFLFAVAFGLQSYTGHMQHLLNHCSMICSVPVKRIGLHYCTLAMRRKYLL